eukprot:4810718-Amphidinium_carterae.1
MKKNQIISMQKMLLGHSTSLIQRISQTSLQMARRLQHQRQLHQSVGQRHRSHQLQKENFTISLTFHSGSGVRFVSGQKQEEQIKGSLKSKGIIQMDYTFLKHSGEPGQKTRLIIVLTMVETVDVKCSHCGAQRCHSICIGRSQESPHSMERCYSVISDFIDCSCQSNFRIPISELTTDHPIFPWMVKHVGFTHNRFQ